MGAVKIDTYNQPLMQVAHYEDIKALKKLLKNYDNLFHLAKMGDNVAASIWVDLKTAIEEGGLTTRQHYCILCYFIDHDTLQDIADDLDISPANVLKSINGGVKRISKALLSGLLYRRGET